uniref:Reverse transcriptase/retrotransposon-derived protein RNase H-like domain-containing protein n=1 Tax=Amphimedon queenslandica TaxID=400682 RepID=A0A1X7V8M1_AMPQE
MTAFATRDALLHFNVLSFGLCNGPITLQCLIDTVLAGLYWIKHAKCELLQKKVHSLGNVVSEKGVSTDPAKTEKDMGWPVRTSQNQLRQFVGLASYCRWFVQDFATISQPLHCLMGNGSQFVWTPDCRMAFNTLQSKLTSRPILAFPDFTLPFILDTDASDCGIGAVLSQNQEGHKQVVAYASRALSKSERNYGVTRKKLFNVITFVSFSSVCILPYALTITL